MEIESWGPRTSDSMEIVHRSTNKQELGLPRLVEPHAPLRDATRLARILPSVEPRLEKGTSKTEVVRQAPLPRSRISHTPFPYQRIQMDMRST